MHTPKPNLSAVFYLLGFLQIVGGIVLCVKLWPDSEALEPGYSYTTMAYIPALTWLSVGVVVGLLFFAVAEGLAYLNDIKQEIRQLREKSPAVKETREDEK
jgi:hypothetical protein